MSSLKLSSDLGHFLGDTRIRLLEAIARHGSISQAAKAVPLSYKAAWDAVDAMNNLAEQPIVLSSTGGRHGGGTQLTEYGQRLVNMYRALEIEYQAALDRISAAMEGGDAGDLAAFQQIIRRMGTRTSVRNQFAGRVIALREGEVDYSVHIEIASGVEICSIITKESAEGLELAINKPVVAMVKSSSVLLQTDPGLKTSARNTLWGEISRVLEGPVNAEITLTLPGGRNVCSVITHESVGRLDIKPGARAAAVFKASSVILFT
jgi:molybdate transport system regulatory protein